MVGAATAENINPALNRQVKQTNGTSLEVMEIPLRGNVNAFDFRPTWWEINQAIRPSSTEGMSQQGTRTELNVAHASTRGRPHARRTHFNQRQSSTCKEGGLADGMVPTKARTSTAAETASLIGLHRTAMNVAGLKATRVAVTAATGVSARSRHFGQSSHPAPVDR